VVSRRAVGLVEVDDELIEVYFGPVLLGWLDGHAARYTSRQSIQSLRRRGSLLAGVFGTSTGVEWKSVAGFHKLSENNA
jgi:hypothetical protein